MTGRDVKHHAAKAWDRTKVGWARLETAQAKAAKPRLGTTRRDEDLDYPPGVDAGAPVAGQGHLLKSLGHAAKEVFWKMPLRLVGAGGDDDDD